MAKNPTPLSNPSIVDFLNAINKDSRYPARKTLAKKYGIQNYAGLGTQNKELLGKLRSQYSKTGGISITTAAPTPRPAPAPAPVKTPTTGYQGYFSPAPPTITKSPVTVIPTKKSILGGKTVTIKKPTEAPVPEKTKTPWQANIIPSKKTMVGGRSITVQGPTPPQIQTLAPPPGLLYTPAGPPVTPPKLTAFEEAKKFATEKTIIPEVAKTVEEAITPSAKEKPTFPKYSYPIQSVNPPIQSFPAVEGETTRVNPNTGQTEIFTLDKWETLPPDPFTTQTTTPTTPSTVPASGYQGNYGYQGYSAPQKQVRTLIDIYEERGDVQREIKKAFPGQDPFIGGTEANIWLNNWWNRVHKDEFPGIILPESPAIVTGKTTKGGQEDIAKPPTGVDKDLPPVVDKDLLIDLPIDEDLPPIDEELPPDEDKGVDEDEDKRNEAADEAQKEAEKIVDTLGDTDIDMRESAKILEKIREQLEMFEDTPKAPNLAEKFKTERQRLGVEPLETRVSEIDSEIEQINANLFIEAEKAGERLVSMTQIGRRRGKLQKEADRSIMLLNIERSSKARQLNNKLSTIEMIMGFTQTNFTNASSLYDREFKKNVDMYNLMKGIEDTEKTETEREIDNARANWTTISNLISKGNLNLGSLTPEQQTKLNRISLTAGFPNNLLKEIQMGSNGATLKSVTTRLDSQGNKFADIIRQNPDGSIDVINKYLGPESPKQSESAFKREGISEMAKYLAPKLNADGKLEPADYQIGKTAWINEGLTAKSFDEAFASLYVIRERIREYSLEFILGF